MKCGVYINSDETASIINTEEVRYKTETNKGKINA